MCERLYYNFLQKQARETLVEELHFGTPGLLAGPVHPTKGEGLGLRTSLDRNNLQLWFLFCCVFFLVNHLMGLPKAHFPLDRSDHSRDPSLGPLPPPTPSCTNKLVRWTTSRLGPSPFLAGEDTFVLTQTVSPYLPSLSVNKALPLHWNVSEGRDRPFLWAYQLIGVGYRS